jgi:trehalose synthase
VFGKIAIAARSVEDHVPHAGQEAIDELRALAAPLAGRRVLFLSSTSASPAVRSLLRSAVPLFNDLGIELSWQQVRVGSEYQTMDRTLRQGLSGFPVEWGQEMEESWWRFNLANAASFDEDYDVVVVHHTASVGLHAAITQTRGRAPAGVWLWASHRDYRAALPESWSLIRRHAAAFDGAVFDHKEFARPDTPTNQRFETPPGIDPLHPRNLPIPEQMRETILAHHGIDHTRPLLAQVVLSLRDDDPLRVLETFRWVRRRSPQVQLAVVNLLTDGPELADALAALREQGARTADVHVFTDMDRIGNVELSALRDEAAVLVHQGFPRGISVELLEEMWAGRPIISGRSGTARALMTHGRTGVLADTPEQQARAALRLLDDPARADAIGRAAHERVASRYLITHHLAAYLRIFTRTLGRAGGRGRSTSR